jgi:hypothetical protein
LTKTSVPQIVTVGRAAARSATQQDWLVVEPLPGYANDLDPMEMV